MDYPMWVSGPGGSGETALQGPERLILVGLKQKRSPALLGGERGFGKLLEVFLGSLSDTNRLTAHLRVKDKVAHGLTVTGGIHRLSTGAEGP